MTRLLGVSTMALAMTFGLGGTAQALLSKTDQNCINEVNKNLQKVVQTLHKEAEKCIKDQSNAKVADADDCYDADAKGKIAKAKQKALDAWTKKCLAATPSVLDDFFGSDTDNGAEQANAEAMSKEARLLQAFLGSDFSVNVVPNTDKDAAKCQQAVLKELFKCQDTKLKEFNTCKKTALKNGNMTAADIQTLCLGDGGQPDAKGKIFKACFDKLDNAVTKSCIAKGVDLDDVFSAYGGIPTQTSSCDGAATNAEYLSCLERYVECDVCNTINASDGTNQDCDLFDDGLDNNSCGECRNAADQDGIVDLQNCVTACPSGDTVCALNCILDAELSSTCNDCFVLDVFSCAAANCLGACDDAMSDACLICINVNNCIDCLGETP